MDWFDSIFVSFIGIIILTILIYSIFKDINIGAKISVTLPPKTSLSHIPVQVKPDPETDDDDDKPTYRACYTRSELAKQAYHLDGGFADDTYLENFQEGFGSMDAFKKFFEIIGELFKLALHAIYVMFTFPDHILAFGEGFIMLGIGVIHLFENFIEQLFRIFSDGSALFKDITRCGLTWSQNLRICFLWYIVDLILYTLIAIVFWIPIYVIRFLTFGKVDLNKLYLAMFGVSDKNKAHKMRDIDGNICHKDGLLEKLDQLLYKKTSLHFMHFPDKVLADCFGCDIVGDVLKLLYDSTFGLISILEQPIEDVWDAGKLFWHALWLDEFF
uniref:Uncharacterized protein n=1 Tax=viral metagenome TaxID=1070528 RepID=A0A6C0IBC7_9ZZZZ